MCRSVYDTLVAGGRFIAYTINPAFTLSKPNGTKYGVTVLREAPEEDRYACEAEFVTDPPFRVSGTGGARPRMSGRSGRPDSGTSPGTPRRWRRKTSRTMGKRIGRISTTIARSSGWSARSDLGHPPDGRGHPERSANRGQRRCQTGAGGALSKPQAQRQSHAAVETGDVPARARVYPCLATDGRQRPPHSRYQPRHHQTHSGNRSSQPRGRGHARACSREIT